MTQPQDPLSPCIVFYSWQSDLQNATNRGFIERALEAAAKAIRTDKSVAVEPVVRQDTQGMAGSPDITAAIFRRIEEATVFVADVSIVNSGVREAKSTGDELLRLGRPSPNPNVLVELGYALHALGDDNVLLVMNTAFGEIELLPFDLRNRRIIRYDMPDDVTERAPERRTLQSQLDVALRDVFHRTTSKSVQMPSPPTLAEQTCAAVETSQPTQAALAKRYMKQVASAVAALMPSFQDARESRSDERLMDAIGQTTSIVLEFTSVAEALAEMPSGADATHATYEGFTDLLDLYWLPRSHTSGISYPEAFDLPKFVGHEAFVTLFAMLLRHGRWQLIRELLDEFLYVSALPQGESGLVEFSYVSQRVRLLDARNRRLNLHKLTLHGQLLCERHKDGELANVMPLAEFADADYLLYLRGQLHPNDTPKAVAWRPWSSLYMSDVPRYLQMATSLKGAERLSLALGVETIADLRKRFIDRVESPSILFGAAFHAEPMDRFDASVLGSRA